MMVVVCPKEYLIDGRPHRSKLEYPYSYDPITIFLSGVESNGSCYSDRMSRWDYKKFDECSKTVFGRTTSNFSNEKEKDIERFLQLYFDDSGLVLTEIVEYCNESNGFPVWYFGYYSPKKG